MFSSSATTNVYILNANGTPRETITTSSGQHQQIITLSDNGTFYFRVNNPAGLNDSYTLSVVPIPPPGANFQRTPYSGHRVEIINNHLIVNGARVSSLEVVEGPSWPNTNQSNRTIFRADNLVVAPNFRVGFFWCSRAPIGTIFHDVIEVRVRINDGFSRREYWNNSGMLVLLRDFNLHPTPNQNHYMTFFFNANTNERISETFDLSPHWSMWRTQTHSQRIASMNTPASTAQAPQNLSINFANESLFGSGTALMQYSLNGGAWRNFADSSLNISSSIPAAGRADNSLRIRYRETTMFLASEPVEIIIPARSPNAPLAANVRFDGFTESITLNDTMEYRLGTTGTWIPVEAGQTSLPVYVSSAVRGTVEVRTRGTSTTFPSATLSITVPWRGSAPNAVYNATSDSITGVSSAAEFSVDGGYTWTRLTANNIPRLTLGQDAVTVHVRWAATATAPVSLVRVVEVPAGPAVAPSGFEVDYLIADSESLLLGYPKIYKINKDNDALCDILNIS